MLFVYLMTYRYNRSTLGLWQLGMMSVGEAFMYNEWGLHVVEGLAVFENYEAALSIS